MTCRHSLVQVHQKQSDDSKPDTEVARPAPQRVSRRAARARRQRAEARRRRTETRRNAPSTEAKSLRRTYVNGQTYTHTTPPPPPPHRRRRRRRRRRSTSTARRSSSSRARRLLSEEEKLPALPRAFNMSSMDHKTLLATHLNKVWILDSGCTVANGISNRPKGEWKHYSEGSTGQSIGTYSGGGGVDVYGVGSVGNLPQHQSCSSWLWEPPEFQTTPTLA